MITPKKLRILAAVGISCGFLLLAKMNHSLETQISVLSQQLSQLGDQYQSLQGELSSQEARIQETLSQQASLFARSEHTLELRDGQPVLTLSLLPKELSPDESLTLSVEGETVPLEMDADGVWQGSIPLPITEGIFPVVRISSSTGVRQEQLDPLYLGGLFQISGESIFSSNTPPFQLHMCLYPDKSGPVSDQEDVESLTLIVREEGSGYELGRVEMSPSARPSSDILFGDHTYPSGLLWYSADLTPYTQKETYDLEFWLELTLPGGILLTDGNPAASYAKHTEGTSSSSGQFQLGLSRQE